MKEILFTEKTRSLLQSAGWFPERDVLIFIAESGGELLPPASKVLREFGNLSIHGESNEWLTFGPEFDFGDDTILSERPDADVADEARAMLSQRRQATTLASNSWKFVAESRLCCRGSKSIADATNCFDQVCSIVKLQADAPEMDVYCSARLLAW